MEGRRTLGGGADKSEGSEQKDGETTGGRSSSSASFVIPNGLMMATGRDRTRDKSESAIAGIRRGYAVVRTYTRWSRISTVVQRVPMIVKAPNLLANTLPLVMVICWIVETEATPAT